MVYVTIHLFRQPAWELHGFINLTPTEIRNFATTMHTRLMNVADIVEKLLQNGWMIDLTGVQDVTLHKEILQHEAAQELEIIGAAHLIQSIISR